MNLDQLPQSGGIMPALHPDIFWYAIISIAVLLLAFYIHARLR